MQKSPGPQPRATSLSLSISRSLSIYLSIYLFMCIYEIWIVNYFNTRRSGTVRLLLWRRGQSVEDGFAAGTRQGCLRVGWVSSYTGARVSFKGFYKDSTPSVYGACMV